jgi:monoamine oxidase
MPDLGSPLVKEVRRLAAAYEAWPGPSSAVPSEVLAWQAAQVGTQQEPRVGEDSAGVGRRQFLQGGLAVGAGVLGAVAGVGQGSALAAPRRDARVVVVGAGLAGLTCTYRLRQAGVAAVAYEAQRRLGGRCYSIRDFFDARQTAEHGGQYIDSRHRQFRSLARELGVELVDTFAQSFPSGDLDHRWIDGALRSSDEVYAQFGDFYARLRRDYRKAGDYHWDKAGPYAVQIDQMTMTEYLDAAVDGGSESLLGRAIGAGMQSFFGLEPAAMSAINLFEGYVAPYPGANERYRVAGGNDRMVQALEQALPREAVKRGRMLEAIWHTYDGRIRMHFSGDSGDVVADRVVLALPFTTLRNVETSGLTLSPRRRRAIRQLAMGSNAKLNLQLNRSLAALDWTGGFFSDEPHYVTWDSTYGQSHPAPHHPVMTIYNGGDEGAGYPTDVAHGPAPEAVVATALGNLARGVKGIRRAYGGKAYLDSWVDDPYVGGSYAGFGPGQYTDYWGFLRRREGAVVFAGEHTSTHSQGYLNGGVESGEHAAALTRRSLGISG